MRILDKVFKKPLRCKHRHTMNGKNGHPNCFNADGTLKQLNLPKILVFDIETSPLEAFVFQTQVWKAKISDDAVISQWFMLTWSAKYLFDNKIMSAKLTGREALAEDDSRIVKELWKLLDDADIVIAHNGNSFDVPNMNTRFIVNELPPPSPYQQIDTLKVAQKQFGFTHNSLNALARVLGVDGEKLDTDFELWKRAKNGEDEALSYMEKYNKEDVQLLEDVYMKLRPWIKGHPNLGLYVEADEPICGHCGSDDLTPTDKFSYTTVSKFPLYRCNCGAYVRVRKSVVSKSVRENLTVPLYR